MMPDDEITVQKTSQFGNLMLDYDRLFFLADDNAKAYQVAEPFPHVVLDDFISEAVLAALLEGFSDPDIDAQNKDFNPRNRETGVLLQANKVSLREERQFSPAVRQLNWELNSPSFMEFLTRLTGIQNLIGDPQIRGGGIHQTLPGGLLKVHVDFCIHPKLQLDRRINLLIYLNENWQDAYGGDLELWNKDVTSLVKKVSPIARRCVIFSTGANTWHGHPRPLTCPPERSRKSFALYYYTNGRPESEKAECSHGRKTLWREVPEL